MRTRTKLYAYTVTLLFLCVAGWVLSVVASHSESVSYVDASSSPDKDTFGERHYKTISEALAHHLTEPYEKIIVRPGVYTEDLTINVAGVHLISERGPDQTKIIGQVTITSRQVRLEGFEIIAKDKPSAVALSGFGIQIVRNRLRDANIGIEVQTNSQKIELQANEVFNNTTAGITISGSREVSVSENAMRGNFGTGILIEVSFGVALVSNRVVLNQGAGVRMVKSQPAEIAQNVISGNGDAGLSLKEVSLVEIKENELVSNGVGIVLDQTLSSQIVSNQIKLHRTHGIVLKNSKEIRIEDNEIEQNQGINSSGIRLEGDTSSNEISSNFITSNSVGIALEESGGRRPSNNQISSNEVSDSDESGIIVNASEGQNSFGNNKIFGSSHSGILVISASNESFQKNSIHDNGSYGIHLQKTNENAVLGNKIFANGKSGIALEEGNGNVFAENTIERNTESGIALLNASFTELRANVIRENIQDGLTMQQGESLRLTENRLIQNASRGIALEQVMNVSATNNTVAENSKGGIALTKVADADWMGNTIEKNSQFGLLASDVTNVSARRNYWGSAEGPAGGFSGQGNAIAGLEPQQTIPWLPAPVAQVKLESVTGKLITDSGSDRVQFNAHDTTGIDLELRELRQGDQAQIKTQALITLARYTQVPESVQTMSNGLAYYHVLIRGFDSGVADFTLYYDEAELSTRGADASQLKLYFHKEGQWHALPTQALATSPEVELSRLVAEAKLDQLENGLIALGLEPKATLTLATTLPLLSTKTETTQRALALDEESKESASNSIDSPIETEATLADASQNAFHPQATTSESQTAFAATQATFNASEIFSQSGPDYWGFVFLFFTIFLSWTAIRVYRRYDQKTRE